MEEKIDKYENLYLIGEDEFVEIDALVLSLLEYKAKGFTHFRWSIRSYWSALIAEVASFSDEPQNIYERKVLLDKIDQDEFLFYKKRYEELKSKYES